MGFVTDPAAATKQITGWIRERLQSTGRSQLVLGMSGGIDSALAAHLAVEAVGPQALLCVLMPNKTSHPDSLRHAREVIADLKTNSRELPITAMAEAFEQNVTDLSPLRRGNLCARLRMLTLFDQAHANGLVLGTSNKTESLLGYGTLYGDAAWSLNPLGDLYKTDVWALSKYLGIHPEVIAKAPTADLWEGQTDESELGHTYAEMDKLLVLLVDEKKSRAELLRSGIDAKFLDRIVGLIRAFSFKRKLPPVAWLNPPYSTDHLEVQSW